MSVAQPHRLCARLQGRGLRTQLASAYYVFSNDARFAARTMSNFYSLTGGRGARELLLHLPHLVGHGYVFWTRRSRPPISPVHCRTFAAMHVPQARIYLPAINTATRVAGACAAA